MGDIFAVSLGSSTGWFERQPARVVNGRYDISPMIVASKLVAKAYKIMVHTRRKKSRLSNTVKKNTKGKEKSRKEKRNASYTQTKKTHTHAKI